MLKTIAAIGLNAVLVFPPGAAFAQQGTSSSWGTVGWGPVIPTQELTPKDRSWNFNHESQYRAEEGAEWLRLHPQPSHNPWQR
jgi:hypothetical protein